MALSILVTYPDGQSESFALTSDDVTIGRDPTAGIPLPDSKVSRKHARIFRRGEAYWLEDAGSANGLLLDGLPLSGQALITPGSVAHIGDCQLVVERGPSEAAVPAPAPAGRYISPVGAKDLVGTRFALKVVAGELLGQSFELALGETVIGRDAEAQLTLDVPSISRRHAVMRPHGERSVVVEDLGSANGTFIGELAIAEPRVVALGDRVQFGSLVFELTAATPLAERATVPAPAADVGEQNPERTAGAASKPSEPSEPPLPAAAPPPTEPLAAATAPPPAKVPSPPLPPQGEQAPAELQQPARAGRPSRLLRSPTQVAMARFSSVAAAVAHAFGRRRLARPLLAICALASVIVVGRFGWRHAPSISLRAPVLALGQLLDIMLGDGPRAAERAWQLRRDQAVADAEGALKGGHFEAAKEALVQASRLDATFAPTLHLRSQLERAVRIDAAAQTAISHRAASRWSQALMAASDALEEGREVGLCAEQRAQLTFVVKDSKEHLAGYCAEEARVACGQERYDNCITQAACALGYVRQQSQALAALNLAASVVDAARTARPVQGPGREGGVDVGTAPAIDDRQLVTLYKDARIRLAVLTYAAGDRPLASLRLKNLDSDLSRPVLADVEAVEAALARGMQSEQKGSWTDSLVAYEEGLGVDARLVPRDVPSAPRAELVTAAQRVFLTLGNLAFSKRAWAEALSHWQRGQALGADSLPLLQALEKLQVQAQTEAAALTADNRAAGTAAWCQRAADVLAMTPEAAALHAQARAWLASCKGHRG